MLHCDEKCWLVAVVKTVGYQVVSQKLSVCAVKEAFEEKPAQKTFSLCVAFTEFTTRGNTKQRWSLKQIRAAQQFVQTILTFSAF